MVIISQDGKALVNLDRVSLIFPLATGKGEYNIFASDELRYDNGISLGRYSSIIKRANAALQEMLRYYEHEGMTGMPHAVFEMPKDEALESYDRVPGGDEDE